MFPASSLAQIPASVEAGACLRNIISIFKSILTSLPIRLNPLKITDNNTHICKCNLDE